MSDVSHFDAILAKESTAHLRRGAAILVVVVVVVGAMWLSGLLDPVRFADAWPAIKQLSREMFPPDFGRLDKWLRPLADTLAMSIAGTALAVVISLPLGLLAAPNTTPNRIVYQAARMFLNLLRSIPELIMGIIFVAMVGFGSLPGVLALGIHSIGMIGKFFAESIEHVDPKPIEAARAAGASRFKSYGTRFCRRSCRSSRIRQSIAGNITFAPRRSSARSVPAALASSSSLPCACWNTRRYRPF